MITVNKMKKCLIFIIHCYQIIPFSFHTLCRFNPTCSEYMKEAIERFGIRKGIYLGLKRIKKCHPKGKFGYDPVPQKGEENENIKNNNTY